MHVLFLLFHSSTADRENVFVIRQHLCQHHCQETQVRLLRLSIFLSILYNIWSLSKFHIQVAFPNTTA